ncbi:MBL fold metallo-hydrolase [Streptomyces sp. Je 1-79]|uniref:MBL fold metallo-hydrolase n=1 Tax=Streptomyces sp. Je 1-79 TaxID=2943847 RepID=UPI0021A93BC3|nr:MBL fold metallo-hydrolase [Streptomyces sp. Je 1-79]MCT4352004.1 MBL fold metallo-hydrolase [Streptomyces sp. Je 1-79]
MSDDVITNGRGGHGFGRRSVLRGAAVGTALPFLPTPAQARTPEGSPATAPAPGSVSLRWLGTAGWRIDVGGRTVLFDPYLTRFRTGLFEKAFDPATKIAPTDAALVREYAGRPELILVSHSHWDHIADVPHLAKTTGARVVGTETTFHLLVALGVDPLQISVVKGGEVLDFGDGLTVEVVASLHSRNKNHAYFAPGTLTAPPAAPATISDLPEGDTLAFQVKAGSDGPALFLMGASDIADRPAEGLRPDVAMVAVPSSSATHRYVPRLLRALGHPPVVVPVHWDNFETPLRGPVVPDPAMDLSGLIGQVRRESPASRVVVPDYRTVYGGDLRPRR